MRNPKSARLMITGVVALFAVGVLSGSSYARIDPETIIGIWLFNEGKGDVAEDSSENGFDGKVMNGPKWVDGKFSDALEFDGADDYVDFGADERLKPQQFTVVAWFSTKKLNGYGHIFQSGNDWNDMAGIVFRVHQDGYFQSGVTQGPGNTVSWVNGPNLSAETWYHAALTLDGTNVVLYIDGEKAASTTGANVLYDGNPIRVGSHSHSVSSLFFGLIDEVAYFNEALTQEDIQLIMNEGLEEAINIIAISSAGKLATTWASIRKQ